MPPGLALEAPRLCTPTCYFSASEEVGADTELHVGYSLYVRILSYFFVTPSCTRCSPLVFLQLQKSHWYCIKTAPSFTSPWLSKTPFQTVSVEKRQLADRIYCSLVSEEPAKTSQTLSYCCSKSETMEVLFLFEYYKFARK